MLFFTILLRRLLPSLGLLVLLAACGYKGPLTQAPETPAADSLNPPSVLAPSDQ